MLLFPLMTVLGIAFAVAAVVCFRHSTLMSFPYGLFALLCLGARWLHDASCAFAQPLAVFNLLLLGTAIAAVAYVQAPASRCKTPSQVDWIVVLGCRLVEGKPGRTLTCRLQAALKCYRQHPEARLVVCGGKGEDESCSEAAAMSAFLISQGLSAEEIVKEDQSRTTAENLRNFLQITGSQDASILLVTSDFHMGRSLQLARQIGFTKVAGLPSKTPWTAWFNCALREAFILMAQKIGFHPSNVSIGKKRL